MRAHVLFPLRGQVRAAGPEGCASNSTQLPIEISCLRLIGVPERHLDRIAFAARLWGVAPEDALLSTGTVSEAAYFRALADELGCPFIDEPELADDIDLAQALRTGLFPLAARSGDGPRFICAPRGRTMRMVASGAFELSRCAVTTPARLRRALLSRHGPAIAEEAANGLSYRAPDLSYRGGLRPVQIAALALLGLLGLAAAWLAPSLTASILAIAFLGLVTLRLTTCGEQPRRSRRLLEQHASVTDVAALPVYTVVVPLRAEAAMVRRVLAALIAIDYPLAKLDIKIVIEADDPATANALAAQALPPHIEVLVAPPGKPRTKPRALNVALMFARGSLLTVYDAEDVPEPGQLRLAAAAFANAPKTLGCLQAHLRPDNADGWLASCFALEYAALFEVINPGLERLGVPIPLGGTSNHFRIEALREVGGWDAWNVTEDADLAVRLARAGYTIGDLPAATHEEAPIRLMAWFR